MTTSSYGALPDQIIQEMIESGCIIGAESANVRPASLDLTLSDEVYKVDAIFQPRATETVREVLGLVGKEKHDMDNPFMPGEMYIARLNESLALPEQVYAFCNPKSTTGRLDIHIRLIADRTSRYDTVHPAGWRGELWVSIVPRTFPIVASEGASLNQLRFFSRDTRLSQLELELAVERDKLLWSLDGSEAFMYRDIPVRDDDGSLLLSLDGVSDVIGFRGKQGDTPVELARVGQYSADEYFEPLVPENGYIHLKQGEFYILSTREGVRVPPQLACEMLPMDERSGEFRSHYAGFIDPGWGYGADGAGTGRPLTLEVRPFEDLVARDGQPIAKIRFERIAGLPETIYDETDSNYTVQTGPRLAKQFEISR